MQATTTTFSHQSVLIDANIRWLRQALRLLEHLDDAVYSRTPPGLAPHRAGAHLRHIVEFYQCFLEGLESFHIDYDARRRDETIEGSRDAASGAIRRIVTQLRTHQELKGDRIIRVWLEDAGHSVVHRGYVLSSFYRELQALSSYTVHHFALIAMTVRMHGVHVDRDFGMAPSTLRHMASHTPEAA